FQQYVQYDMDVVLDSKAKTLTSHSDLLYVNHSPDTLDQILMQLYHNAFNEGTIAEKVWADLGDSFGKEKGWTGIKIQSAMIDSTELTFLIRDDTILELALPNELSPGDTLAFTLDWVSVIHPQIDRSGYRGNHYMFAQWYPKFIVYDENGWHDDPFGDYGEFYGEFGNFNVSIDVPAEQIVAATGIVVKGDPGWRQVTVDTSVTWKEWSEDFAKERETTLTELDSTARRQVRFAAENVHDFAWQCSRDFVYEHGSWDGIDVHVLYNLKSGEAWTQDVVRFGVQSLKWLSENFGPYPWPQMTIIEALFGGGMEYPMMVMDGSESEGLTVHEIGHNWFYGLFANDELDDAWLDEGFTSFQTLWYIEHHYPENDYYLTRKYLTPFEFENLPLISAKERDLKPVIEYMLSVKNEPMAQHSYDFIDYSSYSRNVYDKASMMFYSLKAYLGEVRFLAGMQEYYDRWALKHVNEDRFITAMEAGSGEDLDWFFDQWLHTTKYVDYAVIDFDVQELGAENFETTVHLENKGGLFVPISATIYGKDDNQASAVLEEFKFRDSGEIQIPSDFEPVRVELDANDVFLDVDRRNNRSWKELEWRYQFKGWESYPADRNLYLWKPQFGYNDDAGLGLGFRIDRVYRTPGDVVTLELDHNLRSGNPDGSLSFTREVHGLPMQAIWEGELGSWRQLNFASLQHEISWARRFWKNPVHYLTVGMDFTDATNIPDPQLVNDTFTRIFLHYEMQQTLFKGGLGLSALFQHAPEWLGSSGTTFDQTALMLSWTKRVGTVRVVNRINYLSNSTTTPGLVRTRLGTKDLRHYYLDRLNQTMNHSSSLGALGGHYQLAGGARMRAYTDSMNQVLDYAWSNNFDMIYGPTRLGPGRLSINTFVDMGQTSTDARNWSWIGDIGIGLSFTPRWERSNWLTTIIRPMTFKFELPMARIEGGEWEVSEVHKLWMFSVSI
ncbi:MAG: hypothetical protein K9M49_10060, partial [Candidatus Marinimicrobia bacterium]|nr:hypothetical protein [Candidatus Neomarinimicrobiota bacterium]